MRYATYACIQWHGFVWVGFGLNFFPLLCCHLFLHWLLRLMPGVSSEVAAAVTLTLIERSPQFTLASLKVKHFALATLKKR
jgi:hypothetical protein